MLWTAVWGLYLGMMKLTHVPLPAVGMLTAYFAVILAIRVTSGFERGPIWAGLVTAVVLVPLFLAQPVRLPDDPVDALFYGFGFGVLAYWIFDWLAQFVNRVDN